MAFPADSEQTVDFNIVRGGDAPPHVPKRHCGVVRSRNASFSLAWSSCALKQNSHDLFGQIAPCLPSRNFTRYGIANDVAIASLKRVHKKTDVAEHPEVFDHVGLLVNGLPRTAGLPFI
jgi:hypothetical protein